MGTIIEENIGSILIALAITFATLSFCVLQLLKLYCSAKATQPALPQFDPSQQPPPPGAWGHGPPGWQQPGFGWTSQPPPVRSQPPLRAALPTARSRLRTVTEEHATQPSQTTLDATHAQEGGVMSMEDVVKRRLALHDERALRTPAEVLALLKAGNARFWTGQAKVS